MLWHLGLGTIFCLLLICFCISALRTVPLRHLLSKVILRTSEKYILAVLYLNLMNSKNYSVVAFPLIF